MDCPACGARNPDDKRFCADCGAAINAAAKGANDRDAERRQLTVMFCDLVGSTQLSRGLDPEDLRQLVRSYHQVVTGAIAPFDGHIAQFLGDGVLVYFGYPQAHEDDAARAVRSALNVRAAFGKMPTIHESVLRFRVGIATGLVVVGEIGSGTSAAELSAIGETPNLAARLQALAEPDEIVVAEETRLLLGEAFTLESVVAQSMKGFAAPVQAWRVLAERAAATRFEAEHRRGLVKFIGRDSEIMMLLERWSLARDGEGQAVLLTGEAGIGKSRICQTLRERLAEEPSTTVHLQCLPYFRSSALYPVVQHLERASGMTAGDAPEPRAAKLQRFTESLTAVSLGCLLRLMGMPEGGRLPAQGLSPQEEKAQTLEALIEMIRTLSRRQPILLLVEDAHWIDPTTEELIGQFAQCVREMRVLLLITCRPEYTPSWAGASQIARFSVTRLSHKQSLSLVLAVTAGKALPDEVLTEIIRKTDGIPLFIEELTKTVVQSTLLEDTPKGYRLTATLPALAIPVTLQDSLMARLDRLAQAKEVAQVGAVIGRDFGHSLIASVMDSMPASMLEAALSDLVAAELVFRRGTPPNASYSFKHALVRDTAYNSMLKSQRALRHRQIAQALEGPGDTAAVQPELIAFHYQEGGNATQALRYWQAAGDQAMTRSTVREAVVQYTAAIVQLEIARASEPCDDVERRLRSRLGNALLQAEGWASPGAGVNFERARALAASLNQTDDQLKACGSIAACLGAAGRIGDAIEMLMQFGRTELDCAKPMARVACLHSLGMLRMLRGEYVESDRILIEVRRECEQMPENGRLGATHPLVTSLNHRGTNLMHRGLLDSASASARAALDISERGQHANSRVLALIGAARMALLKGDLGQGIELGTAALELANRFDLRTYLGFGKLTLGRALVASRKLDDGIRLCREGYSEWETFSGRFFSALNAADAAEDLLDAGCADEATDFILAGEKTQQETDEKWQVAKFLWLRGRLAEFGGLPAVAESSFRRAIETSDKQGAFLFALQAADSLARLCQSQGRSAEAQAALRPIYDRFTEAFDWPHLVRARSTLGQ